MFFVDMSCTLESIPEDLTAAGEHNGEYLQVAKKGGRSGEETQTYNDWEWDFNIQYSCGITIL